MADRSRPKCRQELKDCFAYCEGRCICLNDTRFGYRCPFYKPFDQVSKERGGSSYGKF